MTTNLENLGSNKVRLEIKLPPERFEKALDQTFRKKRGSYVIPGFRKGKAPRTVIEQRFGSDVFYPDALELLLEEAYPEAVRESGAKIVGDPEVSVDQADPASGVTFSLTAYVMPEVEIPEWKGLRLERETFEVTDEMVEKQVSALAEENARWVETDAPAAMGDQIFIDFAGTLDGEPFEGGSAKYRSVLLGSGEFVPGFEKQIAGMKSGEERDITVRFPARYAAPQLAGKDVVFHIVAHEVRRRELPELDDEFAEDVSEYDTMDELRDHIRSKLRERLDAETRSRLENDALLQVMNKVPVELPPPLVRAEVETSIRSLQRDCLLQGFTLEQLLEQQGVSMEEFTKRQTMQAVMDVKMRLVVQALVEATGAEASEETRAAKIEEMAARQGTDAETVRSKLTETQKEAIDYGIQVEEMMNALLDNAIIETARRDGETDPSNQSEDEAETPRIEI